jgi:hypothetical protein
MNEKSIDRIFDIVYTLCAIVVLLGAFLKLQHYPHGSQMLWTGLIVGTLVSYVDNMRLRQKIKKLEERKFGE